MTTVKEMIEWLETLPQDAEVHCGVEDGAGYERYMKMVPVDIESCYVFDYTHEGYRNNPRIYGRVIVEICGD